MTQTLLNSVVLVLGPSTTTVRTHYADPSHPSRIQTYSHTPID